MLDVLQETSNDFNVLSSLNEIQEEGSLDNPPSAATNTSSPPSGHLATVPLATMSLENQKVAMENAGAAVGLGCFSEIPLMENDGESPSPYKHSLPNVIVRNRNFDRKLLKFPKKSPTKHSKKSASSNSPKKKKVNTFSNLTISAPKSRLVKTTSTTDDDESTTVAYASRITDRKIALNLLKAKEIVHELKPYQSSSLTLKPNLTQEEFNQALEIAARASAQYKLACDLPKCWAFIAFKPRATGDREMNEFMQAIASQRYSDALSHLAAAKDQYATLRSVKTSVHFNREEFSFFEKQDKNRLALLKVSPSGIVNSFASACAIQAMYRAYTITRAAKKLSHIQAAVEMFSVASVANNFLCQAGDKVLDALQDHVTRTGTAVDARITQEEEDERIALIKRSTEATTKVYSLMDQIKGVMDMSRKAEILRSYKQSMIFRELDKRQFVKIRCEMSVKEAKTKGSSVIRSRNVVRTHKAELAERKVQCAKRLQQRYVHKKALQSSLVTALKQEEEAEDRDYKIAEETRRKLLERLQRDYDDAAALYKATRHTDDATKTLTDDNTLDIESKIELMRELMLHEFKTTSSVVEVNAAEAAEARESCIKLFEKPEVAQVVPVVEMERVLLGKDVHDNECYSDDEDFLPAVSSR